MPGCLQCSNQSQCLACNISQSYYLDATNKCQKLSSSAVTSSSCQSANTNSLCLKCNDGYYDSSNVGQCTYGCSLTCDRCYGPHFGLCQQCNPAYAMLNQNCLPLYNHQKGTIYLLYYTALNSLAPITANWAEVRVENRLTDSCLQESVIKGARVRIRLDDMRAYKVDLRWKLYTGEVGYTVTYVSAANATMGTPSSSTVAFSSGHCGTCNAQKVCIDRDGTLTLTSQSIRQHGYL